MKGIALKPLTVAFHETGFIGQIAQENNQPFWFQMSDKQKQQAGWQWGPRNPQSLNRYSYVGNNPIKYTDPSGHTWYLGQSEARYAAQMFREAARAWRSGHEGLVGEVLAAAEMVHAKYLQSAGKNPALASILSMIGSLVSIYGEGKDFIADQLDEIARLIEMANTGSGGVILYAQSWQSLKTIDGTTGQRYVLQLTYPVYSQLPYTLHPGTAKVYGKFRSRFYLEEDYHHLVSQKLLTRNNTKVKRVSSWGY
jgi:RHS repeat-associated protein